MVGMNFKVSINANKEKVTQESKTVNSSSKSHSRNYSNRQNKKSAKSVLTVSSDTPLRYVKWSTRATSKSP